MTDKQESSSVDVNILDNVNIVTDKQSMYRCASAALALIKRYVVVVVVVSSVIFVLHTFHYFPCPVTFL